MLSWKEVSDGYFMHEDDLWTLYLRYDDSGAMLEVYEGTSHVTTVNWGPGPATTGGGEWYMRQSLKVLETEKKKRN